MTQEFLNENDERSSGHGPFYCALCEASGVSCFVLDRGDPNSVRKKYEKDKRNSQIYGSCDFFNDRNPWLG